MSAIKRDGSYELAESGITHGLMGQTTVYPQGSVVSSSCPQIFPSLRFPTSC